MVSAEPRYVVRRYGGKWYVYDTVYAWRIVAAGYNEGFVRRRAEHLNGADS